MSPLKHGLLTGAVALTGAAGLAGAALATPDVGSTATVNGGGSIPISPYWAQAAYCVDRNNTQSYLPGSTAAPMVTTVTTMIPAGNLCPGATPFGVNGIGYAAVGSGAGFIGVLTHEALPGTPTSGGNLTGASTILFGAKTNSNPVGNELFPSIQYGLSDDPLVDTDVATYSVDGGAVYPYPSGAGNVTAPLSYGGFPAGNLTFSGAAAHVANSTAYPVPRNRYGALVQFPLAIDAVALAYAPSPPTAFTYGPGITRLQLDDEAICRIFVGNITNWNDAKLTALNGNLPIKLVGRLDGSGTTSILTRHLAAVCTPFTAGNHTIGNVTFSGNPYTKGTTTLPANVQGLFTLASGSGGVATAVGGASGALGYIGPGYTAGMGGNLLPAALKNSFGNFVLPTAVTARAAFASIQPPQSDINGNFVSAATGAGFRVDPFAWVQSTAATAAVANPSGNTAYPMVGTTNFIGYTCYANSGATALIRTFGAAGFDTLLQNLGLFGLPPAWIKAIANTFTESTGDASALHLFVDTVSATPTNPACTAGGNLVGG